MRDMLWTNILDAIEDLDKKEEGRRSVRSPGYGDDKMMTCHVRYGDSSPGVYKLYIVTARMGGVTVDGPFYDYSVQYWTDMARYDGNSCRVIVTEEWAHYTVSPDVTEAQFAGHAGREFKFEILELEQAYGLRDHGFAVEFDNSAPGTRPPKAILTTRNLWQQGSIPEPMRHLFKVTAKKIL